MVGGARCGGAVGASKADVLSMRTPAMYRVTSRRFVGLHGRSHLVTDNVDARDAAGTVGDCARRTRGRVRGTGARILALAGESAARCVRDDLLQR